MLALMTLTLRLGKVVRPRPMVSSMRTVTGTGVLHAFQKKSSTGIKTSKQDLGIIKRRLAQAESEYGK